MRGAWGPPAPRGEGAEGGSDRSWGAEGPRGATRVSRSCPCDARGVWMPPGSPACRGGPLGALPPRVTPWPWAAPAKRLERAFVANPRGHRHRRVTSCGWHRHGDTATGSAGTAGALGGTGNAGGHWECGVPICTGSTGAHRAPLGLSRLYWEHWGKLGRTEEPGSLRALAVLRCTGMYWELGGALGEPCAMRRTGTRWDSWAILVYTGSAGRSSPAPPLPSCPSPAPSPLSQIPP